MKNLANIARYKIFFSVYLQIILIPQNILKQCLTPSAFLPILTFVQQTFPEFSSDEVNQKFRILWKKIWSYSIGSGLLNTENTYVLWGSRFFFYRWKLFNFLNLMNIRLTKHDKRNFKRGLTVTFEVKNS